MRIATPAIGSSATPPTITVTPSGSGLWTVTNPGETNNLVNAYETFVSVADNAGAFAAVVTGTAGAGNKAVAELKNPAASGKLIALYSVDVFVPVTMAIQIVLDGTTITPATASIPLKAGSAAGVGVVGGSNQLATTGSLIYTTPTLTANVDYPIPQPWLCLLPANHLLQIIGQTVNQAFTANLRWVETTN